MPFEMSDWIKQLHWKVCYPVWLGWFLVFMNSTPNVMAQDTTARITDLRGKIIVQHSTGKQNKHPLAPWEVLRENASLSLPGQATVVLLCSNHHLLTLQGPQTWKLTMASCQQGQKLAPHIVRSFLQNSGRIYPLNRKRILTRKTRGNRKQQSPTVVSPRNTKLLALPDHIFWESVKNAEQYSVEVKQISIDHIQATQLPCAASPKWNHQTICKTKFPDAYQGFYPEREYRLSIRAKIKGTHRSSADVNTTSFTIVSAQQADWVRQQKASLEKQVRSPTTQAILLAGVFLENELYLEAMETYQNLLAQQPAPEIWISLGHVYLLVDLPHYAQWSFQKALQLRRSVSIQGEIAWANSLMALSRGGLDEALLQAQHAEVFFKQAEQTFLVEQTQQLITEIQDQLRE